MEEDDKALYLLSDSNRVFMSEEHEKDVEESFTKEFMSGEPEKDAKQSLTNKELVPKKVTERLRDLTPLVELIAGDKIAPMNHTDGINITIPKKKDKSIQTIVGTIIFF